MQVVLAIMDINLAKYINKWVTEPEPIVQFDEIPTKQNFHLERNCKKTPHMI